MSSGHKNILSFFLAEGARARAYVSATTPSFFLIK
jgi:hypothetical protein